MVAFLEQCNSVGHLYGLWTGHTDEGIHTYYPVNIFSDVDHLKVRDRNVVGLMAKRQLQYIIVNTNNEL